MTLHYLFSDREAKSCTESGFTTRWINPKKWLECARHALFGNARALIIDCDQSGAILEPDTYECTTAMSCRVDK